MKKSKLKLLVKEARKSAKKDIEQSVIIQVKELTTNLAPNTKSVEKEINKGAKQLAKKVAKVLKFDTTVFAEVSEEVKQPEAINETEPVLKTKAPKAKKETVLL
ncbi:hypothetical protein ACFQ3S_08665 [Mucilaginibacter terrae]|uniref:hypothetical protein n=1 Tax=Mucilaginibacter terrae TaxID=1955052 RepID=UPI0036393A5A